MKIVHISDIHTAPSYLIPDLMEGVIKSVNKIDPEFLIITGDLTGDGCELEFECAKDYIDQMEGKKKIIIPGNHDSRNVGYLCFEKVFGPRFKVENFQGVTVVGVDSTQPDLSDGHIGRDKYSRIEKCFNTSDFKVFTLHHHLIPVPNTGREVNIPIDSGDVLDLITRCGVHLVLCGHKHVPWVWNLNGMTILNAGTACTNRVKWNTPQSFNLIELEDKNMKIERFYSSGGNELILEKKLEKYDAF